MAKLGAVHGATTSSSAGWQGGAGGFLGRAELGRGEPAAWLDGGARGARRGEDGVAAADLGTQRSCAAAAGPLIGAS